MATANIAIRHNEWTESERVATRFSTRAGVGTLWVEMSRTPGACQNFSIALLTQLQALLDRVKAQDGAWHEDGQTRTVDYAVLGSGHPDYFSLGGDLHYFHECISEQQAQPLYLYSKQCLDLLYSWATVFLGRATTVALVQGRALGGGFETALAADFIVAEEHSEFGFPEILFGLFPCTGGMSLLSNRIGPYQAERMMTNGRIYTAQELLDLGVIDAICPKGNGEAAVERFIAEHARHGAARKMLQRSRHRLAPLDYAELHTVVEEWVEVAMKLGGDELKAMHMLSRMQRGNAG